MSKQTEIDETQAAIELLLGRLQGIQREVDREGPNGDPRRLGLFLGEVAEVLQDLERYRDETAAALANASTGVAVSRAYLSVGKMAVQATSPAEPATVLSFDRTRSRKNGSR